MHIVGLSFETHHHGAAVISNGHISVALAEESLSRIKADNSTPLRSLRVCLKTAKLQPEDIDVIAIAGLPNAPNIYAMGNQVRRELLAVGPEGFLTLLYHRGDRLIIKRGLRAILLNGLLATGIPQFLLQHELRLRKIQRALPGFRGEIRYVDHHIAHLALPLYLSGFRDCLSVVIEGLDKRNSVSIDTITNRQIISVAVTPWPESPGYFYRLATSLLGFCPQTDGGKVTGLAAYGQVREPAKHFVTQLLASDGTRFRMSDRVHYYRHRFSRSGEIPLQLRNVSKEDIAAAFQHRLETTTAEVVAHACRQTGQSKVIL